jgi:hypothetical protein
MQNPKPAMLYTQLGRELFRESTTFGEDERLSIMSDILRLSSFSVTPDSLEGNSPKLVRDSGDSMHDNSGDRILSRLMFDCADERSKGSFGSGTDQLSPLTRASVDFGRDSLGEWLTDAVDDFGGSEAPDDLDDLSQAIAAAYDSENGGLSGCGRVRGY